jgi:hypothetical protein
LESVSDTARVLLTAVVLASTALGVFGWSIGGLEAGGPARLVAQLRLAQWAALSLAATGAASIGLAVAQASAPLGAIEVTLGLASLVVAAIVLQREPRQALLIACAGFVAHALVDIGHRPGGLAPVAPPWFTIGCAVWNVYMAALCYWARR